jgi:uncharacterized protein (DUF3084 family)
MKFFWRALGVIVFTFVLVLALIIANAKSNLLKRAGKPTISMVG